MYYDDRDYYNSENIEELYDEDCLYLDDENEDDWEFNYHNITKELIDD
jgi:hypothetical protein